MRNAEIERAYNTQAEFQQVKTVTARDVDCPACDGKAGQDCTTSRMSVPKTKNGSGVPLMCPERIALARELAAQGELAVAVQDAPMVRVSGLYTASCGCVKGGDVGGLAERVKIPCPAHRCMVMRVTTKGERERCMGTRADGSDFCRNHRCTVTGCAEKATAKRRCPAHQQDAVKPAPPRRQPARSGPSRKEDLWPLVPKLRAEGRPWHDIAAELQIAYSTLVAWRRDENYQDAA